ncbi:shikimate dehydrogenase [Microbacterium sp. BK668]|uniref:shikimate dehydrogenase family protein n=1 Tax=Microbacterium sp. BK668 TaxID=2512118 RepID=UPI00105DC54C|nr:shikimate dehydrogenase [Microbacterium sp. BK668]
MVLRQPGQVLSADASRLEVWGDPIAHSRSPELHAAAYRVLGRDWTYGRRQVDEAEFAAQLASLDGSWRGLSLTMPLKGVAFAAARSNDRRAALTGATNTLLLDRAGPLGFNTDVGGIVRALGDEGLPAVDRARIVGAGATATSALVALGELGAQRVEVVARRRAAADPLRELGERLGVVVTVVDFARSAYAPVAVTIATLPGDAQVTDAAADALAGSGGLLLDVVYGHWPTALSSAWERAGARAMSGLGMLLHQALLQIRIFTAGDPDVPLDDESSVLAAMREAVVGD